MSRPGSTPYRIACRAFTLVELLTVIAIVGILAAIIIPVSGTVRTKAKIATSASNLRQLGTTVRLFSAEHRQQLPIYFLDHGTYPDHGWMRALWTRAYSPRPIPRITPSPDNSDAFKKEWEGTVFLSPLLEDGANVRSYGYNKYLCRYSGGEPNSVSLSPITFNEIVNPARTVMIGDSQRSVQLTRDSNTTGRNDGWVLLVFADGHVDRLLPPESGNSNPSAGEKRMPYNRDSTFWRGTDSAPDNRPITVW